MRKIATPVRQKITGQEPRGLDAAAQALQSKRPAVAERILVGLLALTPKDADALRLLGIAQHLRRNHAAAIATLRDALAIRPDDTLILNNLGSALRGGGDSAGAIAAFRRATEIDPMLTAAWFNLGKALKNGLHLEQAQQAFEQTLRLDPHYASAWGALGDVLKTMGDIEGAVKCYRTGLRYPIHAPRTWYHLANLKTVAFTSDDVAALGRLVNDPALSDDDQVYAGYALCKALEDQRQYEAGFAALQRANRIKRRKVPWSAEAFTTLITEIDAAFAQPTAQAPDPELGKEVIFVASLPRSGSTLTEQILSSHPQVEGANELPDLHAVIRDESKRREQAFPSWVATTTAADWQRLGRDYMQRVARWKSDKPRFTDKGLTNWQLVGAVVAMLPGARVVNCRRDPLETCLSCYRQLFSRGNYFTYDLSELGAYWRDFDRLSQSWQARYPERVFNQIYEDLLSDPEGQIRRLLQFLDLPFDPVCLEFHRSKRIVRTASAAQVRQPLRRDTARANRYGSALDTLRQALHGPQYFKLSQ